MKRDIDYIVKDGEVLIVDEFTGRIMYGRRYSNGLHQAIEAKEGVTIEVPAPNKILLGVSAVIPFLPSTIYVTFHSFAFKRISIFFSSASPDGMTSLLE